MCALLMLTEKVKTKHPIKWTASLLEVEQALCAGDLHGDWGGVGGGGTFSHFLLTGLLNSWDVLSGNTLSTFSGISDFLDIKSDPVSRNKTQFTLVKQSIVSVCVYVCVCVCVCV